MVCGALVLVASARRGTPAALEGGLWASLDNTVPAHSASTEVDIGGREWAAQVAHTARPPAGQFTGGQFLADTVHRQPKHLGVWGGMYWGHAAVPPPASHAASAGAARGRDSGGRWLRAPARGQRGGRASDAAVGGIVEALEHQPDPAPPAWWLRKRKQWLRQQRLAAAKKELTKHLVRINPDFSRSPLAAPQPRGAREPGPALPGLVHVSMPSGHVGVRASQPRPPAAAKAVKREPAPAPQRQDKPAASRAAKGAAKGAGPSLSTLRRALDNAERAAGKGKREPLPAHGAPRARRGARGRAGQRHARAAAAAAAHSVPGTDGDSGQVAALDKTSASLKTLAAAMTRRSFTATPEKLAAIAKSLSLVSLSLAGSAAQDSHAAGAAGLGVRS